MKKICSILIMTLLSTLLITAISLAAEKGPAEMVLKSTVDPAAKAKPAFFPHAVHQGSLKCADCHHGKSDDGKQAPYAEGMNIGKCESCHNKAAGMPKKMETFKNAAHELCKGCHKKLTAEGKKAGPTKCNGCHKKDLK